MKILSQKKSFFVHLQNVDGLSTGITKFSSEDEAYSVSVVKSGTPCILGEYPTRERANEVLMEIFQSKADTYMMPEE